MSKGVLSTMTWTVRPGQANACIEALRGMFPTTRLKAGFRTISLSRSAVDPDQFILMQEWDAIQDHQAYMRFRTESGDMAMLMAMTAGPPQMGYWSLEPLAEARA